MKRMMSDNDVAGHVGRLIDICQAPRWADFCVVCTFEDFNLTEDASDAAVWEACQEHDVLLITGNRNAEVPESLEVTVRDRNTPDCLPVLTLADPDHIMRYPRYAESVVERLFEVLIDVESLRGAGRLYLP